MPTDPQAEALGSSGVTKKPQCVEWRAGVKGPSTVLCREAVKVWGSGYLEWINAYCLQVSEMHIWVSLMGEAEPHGTLLAKGWCYPTSSGSKISFHLPLNFLLQHISPNAYLQCSCYLLGSQKTAFGFLNKNLPTLHHLTYIPQCHQYLPPLEHPTISLTGRWKALA